MTNDNCSSSCCGQSKSKINEENKLPCPICDKISQMPVELYTVTRLVKRDLRQQVGEDSYHICTNEECKIAYYNAQPYFNIEQLKVPIWFKTGADPKYACYCNRVTFDQVAEFKKSETFAEISSKSNCDILGSITGRKVNTCKERNPTGNCCCEQSFGEAIEQT